MIKKYHNYLLHTNPRHRDEASQNNNCHKTPGRQTKLTPSSRKDTKHCTTKHGTNTEPTQLEQQKTTNQKQQQNHCLRMYSSLTNWGCGAQMDFTATKYSPSVLLLLNTKIV